MWLSCCRDIRPQKWIKSYFVRKPLSREAHTVHHRVEYFGQRSLSWKVTARNSTLQSGRLNGEMLRQYAKETRRQDQRRRSSLELGRHRRGSGARQCPVGLGPGRRCDGPSAPETEASFTKFHYKNCNFRASFNEFDWSCFVLHNKKPLTI